MYDTFLPGNVLKELVEPAGAIIYTKDFKLGDPTISTLELWGAEYQESNALLIRPEHRTKLEKICKREKVDVCFVGNVTGKLYKVVLFSDMSLLNAQIFFLYSVRRF